MGKFDITEITKTTITTGLAGKLLAFMEQIIQENLMFLQDCFLAKLFG